MTWVRLPFRVIHCENYKTDACIWENELDLREVEKLASKCFECKHNKLIKNTTVIKEIE